MKLTLNINKAIDVAAVQHKSQVRKGNNSPYIVHLFKVAWTLSQYTDNENIILAGLLHDTLEDTDYTLAELANDFGQKVADIVLGVTEDVSLKESLGEKASWQERKDKYLEHLKLDSPESLMVCAADKIDNLTSIILDYEVIGSKIWNNFNSSPEDNIWFYEEIIKIIGPQIDPGLANEYKKTLAKARTTIN